MRWQQQWLPLWPAALVWLVLVLPHLTVSAPMLRANVQPMPWWLRALLWSLEHTWPYSRIARAALRFNAALDRLLARDRATSMCCTVCGIWFGTVSLPTHLMEHFPGEETAQLQLEQGWFTRRFTPPPGLSMQQAQEWLDARA